MTYVWRHPSWAHTINRFTLVWSCVGCKNVESKLTSPRSRVTMYSKLSNEFRTFLYKFKCRYLQIKSLNDNKTYLGWALIKFQCNICHENSKIFVWHHPIPDYGCTNLNFSCWYGCQRTLVLICRRSKWKLSGDLKASPISDCVQRSCKRIMNKNI